MSAGDEGLAERLRAAAEEREARFEALPHSYEVDEEVWVRYPLPDADERDRSTWSWLPGTVLEVCGPYEWYVIVEDERLATKDVTGDLYPCCFRDPEELRPFQQERPTS